MRPIASSSRRTTNVPDFNRVLCHLSEGHLLPRLGGNQRGRGSEPRWAADSPLGKGGRTGGNRTRSTTLARSHAARTSRSLGAGGRTRTDDVLLTRQPLWPLELHRLSSAWLDSNQRSREPKSRGMTNFPTGESRGDGAPRSCDTLLSWQGAGTAKTPPVRGAVRGKKSYRLRKELPTIGPDSGVRPGITTSARTHARSPARRVACRVAWSCVVNMSRRVRYGPLLHKAFSPTGLASARGGRGTCPPERT